jgi:hypothetical protein
MAEQAGALGHRLEHRLHVGRRRADHLQHLGRRGLPVERLLRLVEEAHVLDRDGGLIGEGCQQLDLLVGECPHFLAPHDDDADDRVAADHRRAEHGAVAAETLRLGLPVVGIGERIQDLHGLPLEHDAPDQVAAFRPHRNRGNVGLERRRRTVRDGEPVDVAFGPEQERVARLAKPRGVVHQRRQHALQIEVDWLITFSTLATAVW